MFDFLNPYALYLKIGAGVVLALFAGWAIRVNHLRGEYRDKLEHVAAEFKKAGLPETRFSDLADDATRLASDRDAARQDLATANSKIDMQNGQIVIWRQAADAAGAKSDAAAKQAAAAVANRNAWIAQAQSEAQRVAPKPDSQELQECDAVLTAIFRSGF